MALFIAAMVDASTTIDSELTFLIDSELCGLTTVIAKCLREKFCKSQSIFEIKYILPKFPAIWYESYNRNRP